MPVLTRVRSGLALLLAVLVFSIMPPRAATCAKLTQEYDLKAAFLFHFAQFVSWPSEALPRKDMPLTIGILGEDPFGKTLDRVVANETVNGHKLVVRRFHKVDQIDSCQILFISPSEAKRLDQVLSRLDGRSVLTVGETRNFALQSGIVAFVISERKLRLVVNLAAARAARLTISSKLLRQSEIVGPERMQ